MRKVFLLLFLLPNCLHACFFSKSVHVQVVNELPQNSPVLTLHCASKDNDLGYQTLSTSEGFKWKFCDGIFGNTLFFCHLWWDKNEKAFETYKYKRNTPGSDFRWVSKSDGIYVSVDNGPLGKMYEWDNRS